MDSEIKFRLSVGGILLVMEPSCWLVTLDLILKDTTFPSLCSMIPSLEVLDYSALNRGGSESISQRYTAAIASTFMVL